MSLCTRHLNQICAQSRFASSSQVGLFLTLNHVSLKRVVVHAEACKISCRHQFELKTIPIQILPQALLQLMLNIVLVALSFFVCVLLTESSQIWLTWSRVKHGHSHKTVYVNLTLSTLATIRTWKSPRNCHRSGKYVTACLDQCGVAACKIWSGRFLALGAHFEVWVIWVHNSIEPSQLTPV